MMNHPIEGVLVRAELKRGLFGQLSFRDVAVRRADGSEVRMGKIAVAADLRDVMVPGTEGKFFFHDVAGFKGLHGYKAADGAVRGAFPRLLEDAFGALTMVNLVILVTLLTFDGDLRIVPALMAVLGFTAWSVFAASRQAIVHDFAFETGAVRAGRRSTAQRPRHQLV